MLEHRFHEFFTTKLTFIDTSPPFSDEVEGLTKSTCESEESYHLITNLEAIRFSKMLVDTCKTMRRYNQKSTTDIFTTMRTWDLYEEV
jgi:hypothetical protein